MDSWRWIWSQIALEHVNEQLGALEKKIRKNIQEDADLLAFRQCQDRIPPLRLYSLIEQRANTWVGEAYEVYCSIWKEQGRPKSRDFCIAVFQLGLLPFVKNRILNLICFALTTAQPALKIDPNRQYTYDSSEFDQGSQLAGVRRIITSLQNSWSYQVMSVDACDCSPTITTVTPEKAPVMIDNPSLEERVREAQFIWDQIAHERVNERLHRVGFSIHFSSMSSGPRGDAYRAYSEQASRSRNSTSKIPSRELEEAVFMLEDICVQRAFDIYRDESPQKDISNITMLNLIYNRGLVPFIETQILRDTCIRLNSAQPSLGLNVIREDADRFFSYNSQKLRKEFPVVIRIVDGLKARWSDEIAKRVKEILAQSLPASIADMESNRDQRSTANLSSEPAQEIDLQARPQIATSLEATGSAPLARQGSETEVPNGLETSAEKKGNELNATGGHSEVSETATVTAAPIFSHSDTYDSITFKGQNYTLQGRQAEIIRLLHEALKKGHPAVAKRKLLSMPGCEDLTLVRDIFKSRPQLWGELIVNCEDTGEGRGFYRLHPSIKE